MSAFGGPGGGQKVTKPTPPERGSFPLDHDGECKHIMASYLRCIKSHRGTNDPECRNLSKSYLSCRMDRYVPNYSLLIVVPTLPSSPNSLSISLRLKPHPCSYLAQRIEALRDTVLSKDISTWYLVYAG
ncbi:unnamed protein product [Periconia digitata]|uniref:Cytochrome c oxidase assembly protein COX19 n=1 Tax=Periconia digitata TaxID=1303443 RepID=A0A9W4XDT7_9PLEO|nr:unnamed protein product [Periconia digitata]